MEVILHIGMGKTGTTSIQKALARNAENLRSQGVEYLGMWFDMLGARFAGLQGAEEFFHSSPEEMRVHAERLVQYLQQKQSETGIRRFLISNEAMFGNFPNLKPFLEALSLQSDIRLIAYVRDPRDWLPSAYNQWCIYHKTGTGPVPTYKEGGGTLLQAMYGYFDDWQQYFGNILSIRRFSKSVNVVEDFANTLGVTVELPNERTFERIDTSESLLRAIYNNRSPEEVLPNAFDQAFKGVDLANAPSISRLAQESFSFDQTDAIVAEQAALFERIKQSTGLDLLGDPAPVQKKVDADELRNRALEHVLQIVMDQADRIRKLERAVTRLRNKVNKP